MSAVMNHGAHTPDTVMTDARPLSMRDVRDILDRAHAWISEGYQFHDTMEFGGEFYNGQDMKDDLRAAESALYLIERKS